MTYQQARLEDSPYESLHNVLTGSSRDHSLTRGDAWLYGIVVGWGSSLEQVAAKHGWQPDDVARLLRLHATFQEHHLRSSAPQEPEPALPPAGRTYSIHLSEAQLGIYIEGLDFYSRFITGDVRALPDTLRLKRYDPWRVHPALDQFKREVFPDLAQGEHYGIGRFPKDHVGYAGQIAYEMQREGRHLRANLRAAAGEDLTYDIYSNETLKYSDQPLPVVYCTGPNQPKDDERRPRPTRPKF